MEVSRRICILVLWTLLKTICSENPYTRRGSGLNFYIDEEQVRDYLGFPMEISIIKDEQVISYLQMPEFDKHMPVLPPEVDMVKLWWEGNGKKYFYWFEAMTSSQENVMYKPLISIPSSGYIPARRTGFQLAIPCTGRATGVATFQIVLHILENRNRPIPDSPIRIRLRKQCYERSKTPSTVHRKQCQVPCLNGGHCNSFGACVCVPGWDGEQCEKPVCSSPCLNNGTCIGPDMCKCMSKYQGKWCEEALCTSPCLNGGKCVSPGKCSCSTGYLGEFCQISLCTYQCINGGKCIGHNTCHCPVGYEGLFCQKPLCKRNCGPHGICVDVNTCRCEIGWHGKHCNRSQVQGQVKEVWQLREGAVATIFCTFLRKHADDSANQRCTVTGFRGNRRFGRKRRKLRRTQKLFL